MLLEYWDEKLDGKLEEEKVVEQVIKMLLLDSEMAGSQKRMPIPFEKN